MAGTALGEGGLAGVAGLVSAALVLVLCLGLGGFVGWLLGLSRGRQRAAEAGAKLEAELAGLRATAGELRGQLAHLMARGEALEAELGDVRHARAVADTQVAELKLRLAEQGELLETAETRLGDTFRALAADALQANNQGFMALASERLGAVRAETASALEAREKAIEGLVKPVRESLDKVDNKIQELERERGRAHGQLLTELKGLASVHERLQAETGNLSRALRSPTVRGRWGEIQLRRVVELAGMVEHCDFRQQVTLVGDEGRLRPDLVVRMPGDRFVAVDAKVPLDAYLRALEARDDDQRKARLREHGAQVRAHLSKLGSRAYWAELGNAPEFVVLFLPGEGIFGAALEESPGLIEEGVGHRVLLATPTTLIALLQTVFYGWRQERVAENAEKISEQGRLLHERVATLVGHWMKLGASLGKATEHFNAAAASFEGRVLPAARRLEELGAGSKKKIGELPHLDARPRQRGLTDLGGQAEGAEVAVPLPLYRAQTGAPGE